MSNGTAGDFLSYEAPGKELHAEMGIFCPFFVTSLLSMMNETALSGPPGTASIFCSLLLTQVFV